MRISLEEFEGFVRRFKDPVIRDLRSYLRWMHGMSILKVFWCSDWGNLGYIGLKSCGELLGVLRVLRMRVSFYGRGAWKGVEERGEIQDIFLGDKRVRYLEILLKRGEQLLKKRGLELYGVSEWKSEIWSILEDYGLSPYARSVLIMWNLRRGLPKEGNQNVRIRFASRNDLKKLREIQLSSWGFFIPPNFKRQKVLIAYLNGRAVGSAYLNVSTGNIDFGVHVVREYQRRRVGAALLHAARRFFRELGFRNMFVVRVLRALTKINDSDKTALSFYVACGGKIIREYRGFRRKMRHRRLRVPPIKGFIT